MKLTFDGLSIEEGLRIIEAIAGKSIVHFDAGPTPAERLEEEEQLQKPRRRRRTKAEMAEARNEEANAHPEEEPPRCRRRTRAQETGEAEADEEARPKEQPRRLLLDQCLERQQDQKDPDPLRDELAPNP